MINVTFAGHLLLVIFGLLLIFHLLVLLNKIPYDIVWAGKMKNRNEMIRMESISLLVLVIAVAVVAIKIGYVKFFISPMVMQVATWVLFVFFTLNTIGNLTAKNPIEKYGFSFLTIVIALLILRLAIA